MQKLLIKGKQTLNGYIRISGAKNAAVAILPAVVLAGATVSIENIPAIDDVQQILGILTALGAKVKEKEKGWLEIDPSGINSCQPPYEMVKKLRASCYFMGSLLGRFGRAEVPLPGGCDLGPRPLDQHLKGLRALGAHVSQERGLIMVNGQRLPGGHVYLDVVSVGATINIMLAAVRCAGRTIIENAAKEPEIVDAANFLNALGAKIRGAGTDVIKIEGVPELCGAHHTIIPDRIEAGTFLIAGAATGGDVLIQDVIPKHLDPVIAKLKESGLEMDVGDDHIRIRGGGQCNPVDVKTFPYPGFPTDLQPLSMVLLSCIPGTSLIKENVFDSRFKHVDELKRMGAKIKVEGRTAVIEGGTKLNGAPVRATDLRAGAALLVAGLAAEGETILSGIEHIERGYEDFESKLAALGAKIWRLPV